MQTQDVLNLIGTKFNLPYTLQINSSELIVNFVLLWSVYEARFYKKSCNQLKMYVNVDNNVFSNTDFEGYFLEYKNRYISDDNGIRRFNRLLLHTVRNPGNVKADVLEWLRGEPSDSEKQKAVLAIIYRLRNNLFHGNKGIVEINMELEPIEIANRCLYNIINDNRFLAK